MKRAIQAFFLMVFLGFFIHAEEVRVNNVPFGEADVAQIILQKSEKYGIDYRMLFTIASVESNFEPMAISVVTSSAKAQVLKQLASKDIRIQTGTTYHSKISLVSIFPNSYETAVFIIHKLEELGFKFSVGFMQVDTVNFSLEEVKKMFHPEYNLEKAAKHLSGCINQFKTTVHQVECYNRGAGNLSKMLRNGKHYYPYWKRYKDHWRRYFGETL